MKQKKIRKIIDAHYRQLKEQLRKLDGSHDAGHIHGFRVAYKRLRAFLRMLSWQKGMQGEIKLAKGLKKIYHILGKMRDLQLQQERVAEIVDKDTASSPGFDQLLSKEFRQLHKKLSKLLAGNPLKRSHQQTSLLLPTHLNRTCSNNFMQYEWAAIHQVICAGHFEDNALHSIRKSLKDVLYNLKQFESSHHIILFAAPWKYKQPQDIEELLDELGQLQDIVTAIRLVKEQWLGKLTPLQKMTMLQARDQWTRDKQTRKRRVVKKLQAGINQS